VSWRRIVPELVEVWSLSLSKVVPELVEGTVLAPPLSFRQAQRPISVPEHVEVRSLSLSKGQFLLPPCRFDKLNDQNRPFKMIRRRLSSPPRRNQIPPFNCSSMALIRASASAFFFRSIATSSGFALATNFSLANFFSTACKKPF
jgi:hypothetical protein